MKSPVTSMGSKLSEANADLSFIDDILSQTCEQMDDQDERQLNLPSDDFLNFFDEGSLTTTRSEELSSVLSIDAPRLPLESGFAGSSSGSSLSPSSVSQHSSSFLGDSSPPHTSDTSAGYSPCHVPDGDTMLPGGSPVQDSSFLQTININDLVERHTITPEHSYTQPLFYTAMPITIGTSTGLAAPSLQSPGEESTMIEISYQDSNAGSSDEADQGVEMISYPVQRMPLRVPTANRKFAQNRLELTEQEKMLLAHEGHSLPTHVPLTKDEQRILTRVRRKIRNKQSARNSRQKRQEYMEGLETRVKKCTSENSMLKKKVAVLEKRNNTLLSQFQKLQEYVRSTLQKQDSPLAAVNDDISVSAQSSNTSGRGIPVPRQRTAAGGSRLPSGLMFLLLMSFALVIVPSWWPGTTVDVMSGPKRASQNPVAGHSRSLLYVPERESQSSPDDYGVSMKPGAPDIAASIMEVPNVAQLGTPDLSSTSRVASTVAVDLIPLDDNVTCNGTVPGGALM